MKLGYESNENHKIFRNILIVLYHIYMNNNDFVLLVMYVNQNRYP